MSEAQETELHIPAALHTNGGALPEQWQPRGQICLLEHMFYGSLVLDNWELVLTAAGESSICWIPKILAQP